MIIWLFDGDYCVYKNKKKNKKKFEASHKPIISYFVIIFYFVLYEIWIEYKCNKCNIININIINVINIIKREVKKVEVILYGISIL